MFEKSKSACGREFWLSEIEKIPDGELKNFILDFEKIIRNYSRQETAIFYEYDNGNFPDVHKVFTVNAVKIGSEDMKIMQRMSEAGKGKNFHLYVQSERLCVTFSPDKKPMISVFTCIGDRVCHNKDFLYLLPRSKYKNHTFNIVSSDEIYYKGSRDYPLNLKVFMRLTDFFMVFDFFSALLPVWQTKSYLWRDIAENAEDLKRRAPVYPPLQLKTVLQFHNVYDYLSAKIKGAKIPKTVNKMRFEKSYYIFKASEKTEEKHRDKLRGLYDFDFEKSYFWKTARTEKDRVKAVFCMYYEAFLPEYDSRKHSQILEDYANMMFLQKNPVPLTVKSVKRLLREHDAAANDIRAKQTPAIKIPAKSKFNALKLPPDYVRIKTKKKLLEESETQRHCVWAYGGAINSDRCAIYSVTYENERYTVEIRARSEKFYVNQCRGKFNKDAPEEFQKELRELLRKENIRIAKRK